VAKIEKLEEKISLAKETVNGAKSRKEEVLRRWL